MEMNIPQLGVCAKCSLWATDKLGSFFCLCAYGSFVVSDLRWPIVFKTVDVSLHTHLCRVFLFDTLNHSGTGNALFAKEWSGRAWIWSHSFLMLSKATDETIVPHQLTRRRHRAQMLERLSKMKCTPMKCKVHYCFIRCCFFFLSLSLSLSFSQ